MPSSVARVTSARRALGQGNLISGNLQGGILIQGTGTTANRILGNIIGADLAGMRAVANGQNGVIISDNAGGNVVGGASPGEGNLISGNRQDGVRIQISGTSTNRVLGNIIGADATGTSPLANQGHGVLISGADHNVIGEAGAGNLISGNMQSGIWIQEAGADSNQVAGNIIGADAAGQAQCPTEGMAFTSAARAGTWSVGQPTARPT